MNPSRLKLAFVFLFLFSAAATLAGQQEPATGAATAAEPAAAADEIADPADEKPDPKRDARRLAAIEKARLGDKTLIILKTSCVTYAGTDSRIEARVNTPDGYSSWIELDNSGNDRERCDENHYYVKFPHLSGSVLHLRTNSRGAGPAWRLYRAEVHPPSTFPPSNEVWDIWIGDRKWRGDWCIYENGVPYNCK